MKLTRSQLVKKFPAFYENPTLFTTFTSSRHLSLSWARCFIKTGRICYATNRVPVSSENMFHLVTCWFCVLNSLLFISLFMLCSYIYLENRFLLQPLKTECNLLSFSLKNIIKYKETWTNNLFSSTPWRLMWIYIRKIHFVPHREHRVLLLAPPVGECCLGI